MKEGGRSGEGVVKKKSSSGCLIIKKKSGDNNGVGMGGFSGGHSSSRQVFDSVKDKKRSRMIVNDSDSSEESLEPVRRKVDTFRNGGAAVYNKGYMVNTEIERDRIRIGRPVFDFDEKTGRDFYDERLKLNRHNGNRESDSGSGRFMVDKRKHSHLDSDSNVVRGKTKSMYGSKSRYESEDDEGHLRISVPRERCMEGSDEPIRVQGKNGVLKVMVNKKKNMDFAHKRYDHVDVKGSRNVGSEDVFKKKLGLPQRSYDHVGAEDKKASRSEDPIKMKAAVRPSFHSDKLPEKLTASVRIDKTEVKMRKSLSTKSIKEADDSDTALRLGSSNNMQACTSVKNVKNEGRETLQTEKITPVKGGTESKAKRGTGTEKQLLREKIRNMLLVAGWTIDYRPRRNRDYLDAVYINPSGTAYWSIIKAYEAFQKEEKTAVKPVGDFTPLPDEILSKLTRQTRKKRERELKKKRRDEGSSRSAKKAKVKESADGMDCDQQDKKLNSYMKPNHKAVEGRLKEADHVSGGDSSDNLEAETSRQDRDAKPSSGNLVQGRKSRKIGRTLVVRSSDKGPNSENDGFVPYTGKRTLLSWLIDSGIVEMSEKVQYMNRKKTRAMLEGWITRDGIHCGCCSKILTVSKFELHAGSKLRLPFSSIFLQSGQSLLQCQIDAWNKQEESDRKGFHAVDIDGNDPNDDTCGLCGDGGDLICCDGCPSTFHQSCLNIQMLPKGDWHCPNCACKFCGISVGSSTEAGRGAETALLMCRLCEKKCHESCSEGLGDVAADCGDANISFCGNKCREIYRHLLKLLGVKHELESGFSWSLLCRTDPSSDTLPLEYSQKVECNSKLAVALSVMDECFLPIVDRRSGINLIHNVLYNCGSNFSRLNYSGFYTAILERGDEIIAAASIRIHDTQLAEMPFIGTRHLYRRQGMCRRLLSAIESALYSFKVEKLIIPAIAEHMHTWTDVFGFSPIEESHKKEMRSMNMLVFPGTDMLQKPIKRPEITKGNIAPPSGESCLKADIDNLSTIKSEVDLSNVNEINVKVVSTESSSQTTPAAPSDDSSLDNAHDSVSQPSSKDQITCPAIPTPGEPALGSSVKVDIQVPILENKSKLNSSLGLDLNTFDNSEEPEGSDIVDKVAHVDSKKVMESARDLLGEPPCDASAVTLETPEPQLDIKDSESKIELHPTPVSDLSSVAPETSVSPKENIPSLKLENGSLGKENLAEVGNKDSKSESVSAAVALGTLALQLDSKVSEPKLELQPMPVSDLSSVALETSVPPKENIPSVTPIEDIPSLKLEKEPLGEEKSAEDGDKDSKSESVSAAVAIGTPAPQLDSKGSALQLQPMPNSDLSPVALETYVPPEDNIPSLELENESSGEEKPAEDGDKDSKSESVSVAVAIGTPAPQLDSKGSALELQPVPISDLSPVALETYVPPEENIPSLKLENESSLGEEKPAEDGDNDSKSESVSAAAAIRTPAPQLDSKGSELESQPMPISDLSPVAFETYVPPKEKIPFLKLENKSLGEEKIAEDGHKGSKSESVSAAAAIGTPTPQLDSKGSELETQPMPISDLSSVAFETSIPPKENIPSLNLENGSLEKENPAEEGNKDSKSESVSAAVALGTSTPQLDSKGSEPKFELQPMPVSDLSPVAFETSVPPKEDVSVLKLENESLGVENPAEDANKDSKSESPASVTLETLEPLLDRNSSESNLSVSDSSPVALETSVPRIENIPSLELENESLVEEKTGEDGSKVSKPESLSATQRIINETNVKLSSELNLSSKEETKCKMDVASEVASNAETEHKENKCIPQLLL